jgi:hypothetical protein
VGLAGAGCQTAATITPRLAGRERAESARPASSFSIPSLIFVPGVLVVLLALLWAYSVARDADPLPFPDRDHYVLSTSSLAGLIARQELMQ